MEIKKTREGKEKRALDDVISDQRKISDEVPVDVDVLDRIYTSPEEAKDEVWRRWNDEVLKKKVLEFLGGDIPEPLKGGPKVVFARNIISPSGDLLEFLRIAGRISLEPAFFEPRNDKFTSSNPDKYFLGKMKFYYDIGKNGQGKFYSLKVIDFDKYDGKPVSSIQTIWGESFLDFHHRAFDSIVREHSSSEIYNVSPWVERNGGSSEKFYVKYLALFLCYGVLSEIFFTDNEEEKFVKNVLIPSLKILEDTFRVKPLIVRTFQKGNSCDDGGRCDAFLHWMCYPASVAKLLPIQHSHINSHVSLAHQSSTGE